jgi:diguanylate cyclase (GGDEF)-like protein
MTRSPADMDAIRRIKRIIYLAALPLVVTLGFVTRSVESDLGTLPVTNSVALVVVLALGSLLWLMLWVRRDVRPLELLFVVLAGVYLLATLYVASSEPYHSDEDSLMLLARIGYWYTPYFLLVTMVFGTRGGLIVSGIFLGLALYPGIGHFQNPSGHHPTELLMLAQMYVSMALVILLLAVLSSIGRLQARYALAMEVAANTDALTGLSNRRHLMQVVDEEIVRAQRYQRDLALIFFDIDHFKRVNDSHGHEVGDRVLEGLRDLFRAHMRQVDTLGRWGGEEFMVLTPEMNEEQAAALADRLRQVVEEHAFAEGVRLTASFGVSALTAGDSVADLTRRADAALYRAKRGGRNLVATWGEDPTPEAESALGS